MVKLNYKAVINDLKKYIEPGRAQVLSSFFKDREKDTFIGISTPHIRLVAQRYIDISLNDLDELLQHKVHEYRLCALLILVLKVKRLYGKSYKNQRLMHHDIVRYYLKNLKYINNWDLVDTSAHAIYGPYLYLYKKDSARAVLAMHTQSENIWERRIAMVATWYIIRNGTNADLDSAIYIAEKLINDKQDLIHKAVGWMLREVGKKDERVLSTFLDKYAAYMPRTMLRYALERLDSRKKAFYMSKKKK